MLGLVDNGTTLLLNTEGDSKIYKWNFLTEESMYLETSVELPRSFANGASVSSSDGKIIWLGGGDSDTANTAIMYSEGSLQSLATYPTKLDQACVTFIEGDDQDYFFVLGTFLCRYIWSVFDFLFQLQVVDFGQMIQMPKRLQIL